MITIVATTIAITITITLIAASLFDIDQFLEMNKEKMNSVLDSSGSLSLGNTRGAGSSRDASHNWDVNNNTASLRTLLLHSRAMEKNLISLESRVDGLLSTITADMQLDSGDVSSLILSSFDSSLSINDY